MDAVSQLEAARELSQLREDDGSADAPWLDSRELATPPRPYSEDDWARDSRRARAAGLDVSRAAWQAGADQGIDVVGRLADEHRRLTIAQRQAESDRRLASAKEREDLKRAHAILEEQQVRAKRAAADANARLASRPATADRGVSQWGSYSSPPVPPLIAAPANGRVQSSGF
jgi:hypothetical protein